MGFLVRFTYKNYKVPCSKWKNINWGERVIMEFDQTESHYYLHLILLSDPKNQQKL